MKKATALLVAAAMMLSMAACGNNGGDTTTAAPAGSTAADNGGEATTAGSGETVSGDYDPASAGEVTVRFSWWGNQVRNEVTENTLDVFEGRYPNVTFETTPQQWADYWTQLNVWASANQLPDLMQHDYAYLEQYIDAGLLLDLTPYVESGALDLSNISESIVDTGKGSDGHVYAVCAGVNAPALIYNKTLTDSLGIEIKDNMTWDDFAAISKEINEKEGYRVYYGYGNSENSITYYARSLGYQSFWTDDGINLTEEEAAGYYQNLLDGIADGWLMDSGALASMDTTSVEGSPMLVQDSDNAYRSWCVLAFSNQLTAYTNAASKIDMELGITTWPSQDPTASNYLKPGQFFAVTRDAQNKDLAVAILNFLINDVEANTTLQAERGVPANNEVAAEIADAIGEVDPCYPIAGEYLEMVGENSSPIFPPLPGWSSEVNNTVIKDNADICLSKNPSMTAEEAAKTLLEEVANIVADFN